MCSTSKLAVWFRRCVFLAFLNIKLTWYLQFSKYILFLSHNPIAQKTI